MIKEVASIDLPVHERMVVRKNRLTPQDYTGGSVPRISIVTGTHGDELVFDRKSGELIGRVGLSNREIDGKPCCELGYIIKGDRQRQGLGYEVGSAVTEYAFHELGMSRLCPERALPRSRRA